ncbi:MULTISPECIES: DUF1800 family protein [unclassified Caulobacter]|uniref:DUF1800 domain-containing protein n=1 Tax=unclassified Caulobacter TaxID=2648921 RepID=UPI0006F35C9E|nr:MULTISPECIES: DUF1800 domain-containing protein [unclassified Caulobacter]KQV56739.1 hypothetical protein ASC62_10505 [Caulobacter sp. Root342]KQV72377.1 hypothetical protein ASC70_01455 [Caulobacter sp. Root343]
MRKQHLGSAAALSLTIFLSGCGGASSDSSGGGSARSGVADAIALAPTGEIMPDEAARLAKQASFGPTPELINAIVAKKSVAAWLDEQFTLTSSSYADLAAKPVPGNFCSTLTGADLTNCTHDNFSAWPMQMRFYADAIGKDDQLRQRVAFALSQIVVASEQDVHNTAGLATFQQILLGNAFGNYRDILKAVTLNGFMGDYLDMADSNKSQPNENYARELMQLFSVGTVLLNPDGTPQTDNTGATIPTYSNTDVKEVARALTGWTWARLNGAALTDNNNRDWSQPMVMYATRFDTGSKTFLGKTVAAGASQPANVDAVVDAVFYHPNTGPYICKRLIQQLTLANPTPAYVERVAAVFANNGASVRGDLRAVVRAIYLDSEARVVSQLPGKVKEPVLLATSLARAIGYTTDGYAFMTRDAGMGQAPFRAPSVFNYYPYDFPLAQGDGLVSPVGKLMTTSTTISRHNFLYDWTVGGDPTRGEFKPTLSATGTVPNWASWEANGANDGKTIDRINLVMLNGTMTPAQRQSLVTAMAAIKNSDPALQARRRAQAALYIVASSPLFQVDR